MGKKSREKRERRAVSEPWQPLVPATWRKGPDPHAMAQTLNIPIEEVMKTIEWCKQSEVYVNNVYTVDVRPAEVWPNSGFPEMIWLSIKRNDREAIHDWRDFQRIKNQLVGEENEAVELYPAESRLIDTANQYHLWVLKDPDARFPFGMTCRKVIDHDPEAERATNTKQRKITP